MDDGTGARAAVSDDATGPAAAPVRRSGFAGSAGVLADAATRFRVVVGRVLARLGVREESFLVVLAAVVGVVTAAAAVGFHELIVLLRDTLFEGAGERLLYGGPGIVLLVVIPAAGGLAVGVIGRLLRAREGHGVVDVMESVVRSSGFERPRVAFEKIVTSGVTIGTGGSAGAEGPIVQIGAAIASAVGGLFRLARHQMPVLIGCGSAAGISAIFNAPIGGLLFTLEVILLDFSIRTITPLVVASVIANVTTRAIFETIERLHPGDAPAYTAIFSSGRFSGGPSGDAVPVLDWFQVPNYLLLGLLCGVIAVAFVRSMQAAERGFAPLRPLGVWRPALGGAVVGLMGVASVGATWGMLGGGKAVPFEAYPMPAFFGDGYGVIELLLSERFYTKPVGPVALLLAGGCAMKIAATCVTLGSGGSGGVIAPSLFLGATAGGLLGLGLRESGLFTGVQPGLYALVGMGAVLAAVVHAPLAAILILFELTQDYRVTLAAMLASVTSVGVARLIYRDSIYTAGLRRRGVRVGGSPDRALARLSVEQVPLEPATVVQPADPVERLLDLTERLSATHFVVVDSQGRYVGLIVPDDLNAALMNRDAVPLMIAGELMRPEVVPVRTSDDLASVLDALNRREMSHLPVVLADAPEKVVGLVSRTGIIRRSQREAEA